MVYATESGSGWEDGRPWVSYIVSKRWVVDIYAGPTGEPGGVELTSLRESDPVTTTALRAIPLVSARVALRRLHSERYGSSVFPTIPKRLKTTDDWKRFAAALKVAEELCPHAPLKYLAEATGTSYATVSARSRSRLAFQAMSQ